MNQRIIKSVTLLVMTLLLPSFMHAATGDILYQNCAGGGSCTGAGSNKGWVRTVETNGCYSGSCLKLVSSLNPLPNGSVRYGAGNTSINTNSIAGKKDITISYWIKFNKDIRNMAGGNIKNFIPYMQGGDRFAVVICDWVNRDWYISSMLGTFRPASWLWVLTTANNSAYAINNGNGTYTTGSGGYTAVDINGVERPGTTWKKFTVYLRLPTTPTSSDGVVKVWYGNELMIDFWNVKPRITPSAATFKNITFYSSSEAGEPFEHWMDEMIIYEGYVPPSGDSSPPPTPPAPDPTPRVDTTPPAVPTGLVVR